MAVPHIGFILAAYALTLLVLGGTILALVYDQRTQKKLLARLSRNEQS